MKKFIITAGLLATLTGLRAQTYLGGGIGNNLAFGEGPVTQGTTLTGVLNLPMSRNISSNISLSLYRVSNAGVMYPSTETPRPFNNTVGFEYSLEFDLTRNLYLETGMLLGSNEKEAIAGVSFGGGMTIFKGRKSKIDVSSKVIYQTGDFVKAYIGGTRDILVVGQVRLMFDLKNRKSKYGYKCFKFK